MKNLNNKLTLIVALASITSLTSAIDISKPLTGLANAGTKIVTAFFDKGVELTAKNLENSTGRMLSSLPVSVRDQVRAELDSAELAKDLATVAIEGSKLGLQEAGKALDVVVSEKASEIAAADKTVSVIKPGAISGVVDAVTTAVADHTESVATKSIGSTNDRKRLYTVMGILAAAAAVFAGAQNSEVVKQAFAGLMGKK